MSVPALRVNPVNRAPLRRGRFVLYWMIAARRTRWSFALDHAIAEARRLGVPLVVLEALRVGYPWASERLHRWVIDGMYDQRARLAATPIAYHAYVEPSAGDGSGLLEALAGEAALVVTDEFPCFFLPRMVAAAGRKLDDLGVRLEAVDGNGLLPLRGADRTFTAAQHFRRHLQKELPRHLGAFPAADPLAHLDLPRAVIPDAVLARWPSLFAHTAFDLAAALARLPIDHAVPTVAERGGEVAARARIDAFFAGRIARYHEARNQPEDDVASGLSPYLHFGHASIHEVIARLFTRDGWTPERLAPKPNGRREGWWNLSPEGEAFIDEAVTWRELGYNASFLDPAYDRLESLPAWATRTLDAHRADRREPCYSHDQLERAQTYDPLWNAAQTQLVREGRMHNYLRMLWGKKILEWSPTPEDALRSLIELNNRWAIDGRNPNSYTGILWTLGKFDRPWAPERPVFGTIRYMSSDNTAKKLRVKDYLHRYRPLDTR